MGFGRTGTLFACQQAGVVPDLMCLSKGITGGMIPFSVVLASEGIYRAFYGGGVQRGFLHSHSYSGSPLGCALACTVLDLFEEEGILDRVARLGRFLRERVASELPRGPHLGEYRQIGLVGALELVEDPGTPKALPSGPASGTAHRSGRPGPGGAASAPGGGGLLPPPLCGDGGGTWTSWRRGPSGRCGRVLGSL